MSNSVVFKLNQGNVTHIPMAVLVRKSVDHEPCLAEYPAVLAQIFDYAVIHEIRMRNGVETFPAVWQQDLLKYRQSLFLCHFAGVLDFPRPFYKCLGLRAKKRNSQILLALWLA